MGISVMAMGAMGLMAVGGDGIYRASNLEADDLVMESMMSPGFLFEGLCTVTVILRIEGG